MGTHYVKKHGLNYDDGLVKCNNYHCLMSSRMSVLPTTYLGYKLRYFIKNENNFAGCKTCLSNYMQFISDELMQ